MEKYIENLAVNKFFDKSENELIYNDLIDYVRSLKIKASPYQRLNAVINATDRLNQKIDIHEMGYANFRQAAHDLF